MKLYRVRSYLLLAAVMTLTAACVLSVGQAQARYQNSVSWTTVVQPAAVDMTSDCLAAEERVILLNELPAEGRTVTFTLLSPVNAAEALTWSTKQSKYVDIQVTGPDGTVLTSGDALELTAGEEQVISMTLTPTELALTTLENTKTVNVKVTCGTLGGTFRTGVTMVETPDTEPEETQAATEPETTEAATEPESTEAPEETVPETSAPQETEAQEETVPAETQGEVTLMGTLTDPTETLATEAATEPETTETAPQETETLEAVSEESDPTEAPTEPEATEAPTDPTEVTEVPTDPTEATEVPTDPTEMMEAPTDPTEATEAPTDPTEVTEAPTDPTEATEAPTDPTEVTEAPTDPTEATEAPTDPTEATEALTDPTEAATEPEEVELLTEGALDTVTGMESDGLLPILLQPTETADRMEISLSRGGEGEAFPAFTRYSWGEVSYLLYDGGILDLELSSEEQQTLLLDLSGADPEDARLTLLVREYLAEEPTAAYAVEITCPSEEAVAETVPVLTESRSEAAAVAEDSPAFSLEFPLAWAGDEDMVLTYTMEMLSREGDAVTYLPIDPEQSGLTVTYTRDTEMGIHELAVSTGAEAAPAGTYRLNVSWAFQGVTVREEQKIFFVRYTQTE